MKKLFIILAFVAFQFTAQAQDQLLNFGVKGSIGMSNFSFGTSGIDTDTRQSWEGGLMLRANIPVLPIYAQVEALYTNVGNTFTVGNQAPQELVTNRVEIPMILGAKIGLGDVSARVFGGIIAQKTVRDNLSEFSNEVELNDFGWGWQAGVGADFKKFTLDLKYQKGANIAAHGPSIESNQYLVSFGYFIW
ncbi:outer membrane beta-barrel protein [Flammeovirga yaeyamensis]|uniref:Outer membrane beta-barrel protein n=1 Tax=Flammeovirga yaeyamensis TaxID=367791 RepID=A0AAX1N1L6_9BACT|nr:outer membrane beta-barrel protein [Flammeovirga yaeyamensis]MBB3698417.1 hypothetical protein [Flammeovirga yaeyamensis]NMF34233.1 porin family protein [Flammeovirga yaeyamensis]QWG01217.1 outer membrane beta-barrel protein [Flammeovirga yaeyamensis]